MEHEVFEKKVMTMLLEGPDPRLRILKKQYLSSTVIDRNFTGRGFFIKFDVPDDLVEGSFNGRVDDIRARIIDNEGNCLEGDYLFFILYVTDGKVDTLECFTTSTYTWDYNYNNIILEYCYDDRREYELS